MGLLQQLFKSLTAEKGSEAVKTAINNQTSPDPPNPSDPEYLEKIREADDAARRANYRQQVEDKQARDAELLKVMQQRNKELQELSEQTKKSIQESDKVDKSTAAGCEESNNILLKGIVKQEEIKAKSDKRVQEIKKQQRTLRENKHKANDQIRRREEARARQLRKEKPHVDKVKKFSFRNILAKDSKLTKIILIGTMLATFLKKFWDRSKVMIMGWLENQPFFQTLKSAYLDLKDKFERFKAWVTPYITWIVDNLKDTWVKFVDWIKTSDNAVAEVIREATGIKKESARTTFERGAAGTKFNKEVNTGESMSWNPEGDHNINTSISNPFEQNVDATVTNPYFKLGDKNSVMDQYIVTNPQSSGVSSASSVRPAEAGGESTTSSGTTLVQGGTTRTYVKNKTVIRHSLRSANQLK